MHQGCPFSIAHDILYALLAWHQWGQSSAKRIVPFVYMKRNRKFIAKGVSNRWAALGASKKGSELQSTYLSWYHMRRRCLDEKNHAWHNYGGRGITVCDKWGTFAGFFADMGHKPSSRHSLDRIDVNGNYNKENCRWATWDIQANNKRKNVRVMFRGQIRPVGELAKSLGINYNTLSARVRRNIKSIDIFSVPRATEHMITYRGETKNLKEWSKQCGIKYQTLVARSNKSSWTLDMVFQPVKKGRE